MHAIKHKDALSITKNVSSDCFEFGSKYEHLVIQDPYADMPRLSDLESTISSLECLSKAEKSLVSLRASGASQQELAKKFGVTQGAISHRLRRIAWKIRFQADNGAPPSADEITAAVSGFDAWLQSRPYNHYRISDAYSSDVLYRWSTGVTQTRLGRSQTKMRYLIKTVLQYLQVTQSPLFSHLNAHWLVASKQPIGYLRKSQRPPNKFNGR